jgi:hypothetical protein
MAINTSQLLSLYNKLETDLNEYFVEDNSFYEYVTNKLLENNIDITDLRNSRFRQDQLKRRIQLYIANINL